LFFTISPYLFKLILVALYWMFDVAS
jgi:hypothetical protein